MWIASVRRFATRVWIRVTSRRAVSQRAEGRCPVRRSGPTRRDNVREAVRSAVRALFRCRGLGTGSPVDSRGQSLDAQVHPDGLCQVSAGALTWRATSTVNAQYQRPASRRTVADRIRTVRGLKAAGQFAGRLVRLDRADPGQGHLLTVGLNARITPVVNRTLGVVRRRALKRGNPTVRPARLGGLGVRPVLRANGLHRPGQC